MVRWWSIPLREMPQTLTLPKFKIKKNNSLQRP